jgi:hypothetical protein
MDSRHLSPVKPEDSGHGPSVSAPLISWKFGRHHLVSASDSEVLGVWLGHQLSLLSEVRGDPANAVVVANINATTVKRTEQNLFFMGDLPCNKMKSLVCDEKEYHIFLFFLYTSLHSPGLF